MPTRPSGATSGCAAIHFTASSITSADRAVIWYSVRSGSAIVITATPLPARSWASAVRRGSAMPIEWTPGTSSAARCTRPSGRYHCAATSPRRVGTMCRGIAVTGRAIALANVSVRPPRFAARTNSDAARAYGAATYTVPPTTRMTAANAASGRDRISGAC
jgi:hypothetical protein